jgi:hypothetical protein
MKSIGMSGVQALGGILLAFTGVSIYEQHEEMAYTAGIRTTIPKSTIQSVLAT